MSISIIPTYSSGVESSDSTLLYWLDREINKSDHNRTLQREIRSITKHLQIFDDRSVCQQAVQSLSEQHRLILIVSGSLGQEIVHEIHPLQQVTSIYIYCSNKALHDEWAKRFPKVLIYLK